MRAYKSDCEIGLLHHHCFTLCAGSSFFCSFRVQFNECHSGQWNIGARRSYGKPWNRTFLVSNKDLCFYVLAVAEGSGDTGVKGRRKTQSSQSN